MNGLMVLRIVLALLGVVSVAVGLFLWSIPAGFVVSGVLAVGVAYVWQALAVGSNE